MCCKQLTNAFAIEAAVSLGLAPSLLCELYVMVQEILNFWKFAFDSAFWEAKLSYFLYPE